MPVLMLPRQVVKCRTHRVPAQLPMPVWTAETSTLPGASRRRTMSCRSFLRSPSPRRRGATLEREGSHCAIYESSSRTRRGRAVDLPSSARVYATGLYSSVDRCSGLVISSIRRVSGSTQWIHFPMRSGASCRQSRRWSGGLPSRTAQAFSPKLMRKYLPAAGIAYLNRDAGDSRYDRVSAEDDGDYWVRAYHLAHPRPDAPWPACPGSPPEGASTCVQNDKRHRFVQRSRASRADVVASRHTLRHFDGRR